MHHHDRLRGERFSHLDLATRTLCKAGIDACIGVAHADILGAFHPDGTRRAAARAAVMRERRSTGASSGAAVDEEEVDAKVEEFRVTSFFCLPKEERWRIIKSLQKGYQDDVITANRGALKAEASARLERLQFKKDEHIRLCDVRCGKYNDYVKIEPCRSLVALAALRAQHGTDLKACAEALRDQIRVRVHVYKIKAAGLPNIGSDSSEAAVQRLVIELRAVVVGALPRSPPPPVPYPTRAVHRAPTAEAAAFHMKHLAAISAALVEVVTVTVDGAFKAPRRRAALATAATPRAQAPREPTPKAPKRPRAPTPGQAALEGVEFEEDGADWKVLAVAWDGELEEMAVWYYDAEMAEEGPS